MIYQPQGASISTVNDSTYGIVTALNNAGYYEFRTITSISGGGSNRFNFSPGLTHSYNTSGKAQVIRVPQYSSLNITATGSIAAKAWDGTSGGVAVVHVQNTATINGSMHANAKGFRGGAADNLSIATLPTAVNVYRTAVADSSAEKGESIAGLASVLAGGQYGRGAPANGGGGGNAHNAGGGGGSNGNNGNTYTGHGVMNGSVTGASAWALDGGWYVHGGSLAQSSGGGRGGYTYSANDINALTQGPGLSGWGGDYRQEKGGRGGHPLNNDASNRVFLGGGGGAGDGNNSCAGAGGIGGGMVFLLTQDLSGSGSLSANAGDGVSTTGAGNDAPGGGGGGGSVIAWVTGSYTGVSLSAKGGKGGNQTIATAETEGPGGGGSGGFIAYPVTASPSADVSGGTGGTTNGSSLTEFPRNGATDGAPGNIATISWIPLPVELVALSATRSDNGIVLRWRTVTESNNYGFEVQRSGDRSAWQSIGFVEGHGTSNVPHEYSLLDGTAGAVTGAGLFYRIKQLDRDGQKHYSPVVEAGIPAENGFRFTGLYPQPAASTVLAVLSFSEARTVRLSIVNTLGAEVLVPLSGIRMETGNTSIPLQVGALLPGTYLCRVTTESGSVSRLLVIAR